MKSKLFWRKILVLAIVQGLIALYCYLISPVENYPHGFEAIVDYQATTQKFIMLGVLWLAFWFVIFFKIPYLKSRMKKH